MGGNQVISTGNCILLELTWVLTMFTSVHSNYSCTTLKIYSVYEMMHVAIGYPCILRNPGSPSLWYFTILLWICFLMFHVMFFPWVFPIFLGACSVCYFCGCIFWFPPVPPLLPGAVWKPSTPFCVSSSDGPITFMWLLAVLFCSHTVARFLSLWTSLSFSLHRPALQPFLSNAYHLAQLQWMPLSLGHAVLQPSHFQRSAPSLWCSFPHVLPATALLACLSVQLAAGWVLNVRPIFYVSQT